jgi:hypothetical protein
MRNWKNCPPSAAAGVIGVKTLPRKFDSIFVARYFDPAIEPALHCSELKRTHPVRLKGDRPGNNQVDVFAVVLSQYSPGAHERILRLRHGFDLRADVLVSGGPLRTANWARRFRPVRST